MKITLTVNEKQAYVIIKALDFYSRIKMGQLNELTRVFDDFDIKTNREIVKILNSLKREMFPNLKGDYYGILDPFVGDGQIAGDIMQVMQYTLAWDRYPEGGLQVIFDEPYHYSDEPLPTVTIKR